MTESDAIEAIRGLMEHIVKSLVDNKDEAEVSVTRGEHTTMFNVCVHKADLGKVIGREGKIAKALRTILLSVSVKAGCRAIMEIIEP